MLKDNTSQLSQLVPDNCPRFDSCNANICPLDSGWPLRSHLRDEPACAYLRAAVKPGGQAHLLGVTSREIAILVLRELPKIIARYSHLRRSLKRAAKRPRKLGRSVGVRNQNERAA